MPLSYHQETFEDEGFIRRLMLEMLSNQLRPASWPAAIRESLLEAQYQVRRQGFRQTADNRPGTVTVLDGKPVAWYVTSEDPQRIHLVSLIVLNDYRAKGIGSAILKNVLDPADRDRKTVRLSVSLGNIRAIALYSRFGFRQLENDGIHIRMERAPQ